MLTRRFRKELCGLLLLHLLACYLHAHPRLPPQSPPAKTKKATRPTRILFKMKESIKVKTPTGELHGTLELPRTPPPYPFALIISGSGPTDRDGNSPLFPGANNSLKLLAEGLAGEGIATLRFDKRGVGESSAAAPAEADLRFDAFVEDAVAWGRELGRDARLSSLVVVGHSEGSLIGMLAAQRLEADAFVSIAGVGRAASRLLAEQLTGKLPPELEERALAIVEQLSAGKTSDDVPAELIALFRPSVQPYLASWFRFDPSREIARLKMPALVVQGTTDLQVGREDAELLSRSATTGRLLLIEGMNHVLKEVSADQEAQMKSYGDPALPVSPILVREIGSFIKEAGRVRTGGL